MLGMCSVSSLGGGPCVGGVFVVCMAPFALQGEGVNHITIEYLSTAAITKL